MKPEVIEIVRRGNSSKIAEICRNMELSYPVKLTVSQNAPCSIKKDGHFPSQLGWEEHVGSISSVIEKYKPKEVWIKTATLGGRRRMWLKY